MKKTLLLFTGLVLSFGVNAQDGIEMYASYTEATYTGAVTQANFPTHDFSGETIEFTPVSQYEMVVDLHVENHTGSSVDWIASRRRINEISGWTDYMCWGHETDQTGGTCVEASTMDVTFYGMPGQEGVTIGDGEAGILAAHINPDHNAPGCVTYRYYIGTGFLPFLDSVDIEVCFSLGVDDKPSVEVNVAPNPANDFVKIDANGAEGSTVTILDVLGNSVRTETMDASTKVINTSDLNNGIYFIRVVGEGIETTSQKIVVRH